MRKRKPKPVNYYRLIPQWIVIALLGLMVIRPIIDKAHKTDIEAYCPFGGLQAFSSYLANNSLACAMSTTQIIAGLALVLGVLLISKLFCSYICPIGTFTEWLGRLGSRYKLRFTITGIADNLLRTLKYGLLFASFYFTVSSSELFCKQFDPYYAIFSGFDGDVTMAYAIPAILITVFGSFFIRQFWCKYLCPLGAAANIFAFAPVFVGITLIYWLIVQFTSIELHWAWYLGIVCATGLVVEVWRRSGLYFPLMKITRDPDICTNCKICDKACPYAIKVSEADSVKHIDCHMCVDCVVKCPEKGALTVNRRPWRWMPVATLIALIVAGLFISAKWELPTIDLKWGTEEQFETAALYEQDGLKNVKCFGSSNAFATQMKKVDGVLGVQTFVKRFGVKVFYDPDITDASKIKAAIFTPVSWILSEPPVDLKTLAFVELGIDRFFDSKDAFLLSELLETSPAIFGMETSFGEPVHARIYFDINTVSTDEIVQLIEKREITYEQGDEQLTERTNFKVAYIEPEVGTVETWSYLQRTFKPFDRTFNDFETYTADDILIYELPFSEVMRQDKQRWLVFLMSHLSADEGIVRFQTVWEEETPMLRCHYVHEKTNLENIQSLLEKEFLTVHYPDETTRDFPNPFSFKIGK